MPSVTIDGIDTYYELTVQGRRYLCARRRFRRDR